MVGEVLGEDVAETEAELEVQTVPEELGEDEAELEEQPVPVKLGEGEALTELIKDALSLALPVTVDDCVSLTVELAETQALGSLLGVTEAELQALSLGDCVRDCKGESEAEAQAEALGLGLTELH